tara:strand:+ start:174 stop:956 length:783 start_codon:yes stop_codon:yes gene_type:complete
MKKYYTYAYLREDRTPYYIGKGSGNRAYRRTKKCIKPPKDKSRIIFLKQNLTEEEAFKHEKYMIAVFGRKDLGTGILHNRTDGGNNPPSWKGKKHSEETKKKLSIVQSSRIRKRKPKHLLKTSKDCPSYKNKLKGKNSKTILKGDNRTEKQKEASKKHRNVIKGRIPTNAKPVKIFNKEYNSIRFACKDNNISYFQYIFLINSNILFKNSSELKEYIWSERNKKISKKSMGNKKTLGTKRTEEVKKKMSVSIKNALKNKK